VGRLTEKNKGSLSFQFQITSGSKSFSSGVVKGHETGLTCTALVNSGPTGKLDNWYKGSLTVANIDGGETANKYETWFLTGQKETSV